MGIMRKIKGFFLYRSAMKRLMDNLSKTPNWKSHINEREFLDRVKRLSKKFCGINSMGRLDINVEMETVYLQRTKQFLRAPKLYITQNMSCCSKFKAIVSLWKKEEDQLKYTLSRGSSKLISGEGSVDSCVKDIEEFLKKDNGKV